MSSVGWAGGQLTVGEADQPPTPLMDRPMMRPAHQRQVGQIGRAAMQPVPQMMGLTPSQRPRTARDHTATITHRQGGPLGGPNDPAGPAHLQRLGGCATQRWWQQGQGGPQPDPQPLHRARVPGQRLPIPTRVPGHRSLIPARVLGHRSLGGAQVAGQRSLVGAAVVVGVVVAAGLAGDQDPGQHTITCQPLTRLGVQRPRPADLPPRLPESPRRLSRSTVTVSCGRTPPVWGSRPPSRLRRASSVRASARR